MSTMHVYQGSSFHNPTAKQNFRVGIKLEVSSSVRPDTFSTRQEGWKEGEVTMSYERALPHHSLCAIMVAKPGIAAAVLDYGLLKCLQFVHSTDATKQVRWSNMDASFLSVDKSMEKTLPWYFRLSRYFPLHYDHIATKATKWLSQQFIFSLFPIFRLFGICRSEQINTHLVCFEGKLICIPLSHFRVGEIQVTRGTCGCGRSQLYT